MPSSRKRKDRLVTGLLDSSVMIAAVLSVGGGSFRILKEVLGGTYHLYISEYSVQEVIRSLYVKYPVKVAVFVKYLEIFPIEILPLPREDSVERCAVVIDIEDAPILATAIENRLSYLLTLDKGDFDFRVKEFSMRHGVEVVSPGEFIRDVFGDSPLK